MANHPNRSAAFSLDTAGNLISKGRIVGHFHADKARNGRYIAYLPGKQHEAIEVLHGPTFKSAAEIASLLGLTASK